MQITQRHLVMLALSLPRPQTHRSCSGYGARVECGRW